VIWTQTRSWRINDCGAKISVVEKLRYRDLPYTNAIPLPTNVRGAARESNFQKTDSRAYLGSKTVQPMGGSSENWSFVVKTHAFLEAAVSQLLAEHIDPRLKPVFDRLELSNPSTGKLALLQPLDLLTDAELKFVRKFSELRNMLVHNINKVQFTFSEHLASLDKNQITAFTDWIVFFAHSDKTIGYARRMVRERPQQSLWLGTIVLVTHCVHLMKTATDERQKKIENAVRELKSGIITLH